jgi:glycosyltransferase involved in cell wall biosynthesis
MSRRIQVLALASYPIESASSRYRVAQFIEPLAQRGIDMTFSPFLDAALFADLYTPGRLWRHSPRLLLSTLRRLGAIVRAARADVVFVQREAMLFGPPLIEWMAARVLRRPMILDLDDATWLPYRSPVYGRLAALMKGKGKTERLIRWSRLVTCGNPNIAADVRSRGAEAILVPSAVDLRLFHPRETANDIPVIGWIGTHTTYPFLERLMPLFDRLAREHRFELTIIGSGRADVDTRPWSMNSEAEDFRSFDIGVYPLTGDEWNARKSGLKAVQYMASGVPFVMSPVGVCATMGVPATPFSPPQRGEGGVPEDPSSALRAPSPLCGGEKGGSLCDETHFLATTDEEWLAALRRLLTDGGLRRRMGQAGRRFAEEHHSLEGAADLLAAACMRARG